MQIVGYDTGLADLQFDPVEGLSGEPDPASLLIAEDGAVRREPLVGGTDLAYTLGDRHCAGELSGSSHDACPNDGVPYCADHADDWPCARCTGSCDKPLPSCDAEHAVYLAGFAPDLLKVGVTKVARLPVRLREQGADRALQLHTVSDGRIARRIERELAADVPDQVRTAAKIDGLPATFDEALWERTLARYDWIEAFEFDYDLDLAERPVAETLVTGTVQGTKGRLLVLRHGSGTYAVDLRDLVGFELRPGATERELQSSLGAFG